LTGLESNLVDYVRPDACSGWVVSEDLLEQTAQAVTKIESESLLHEISGYAQGIVGLRFKIMNITLGSEQEQFIREQLAQGQFQSVNEVLAMALQLLARQQQEYRGWVEDVRGKVDEAAQKLERGEGIPLEVVTDRLQDKFRKAKANFEQLREQPIFH
jgi:antitoxin ParD1/3/4